MNSVQTETLGAEVDTLAQSNRALTSGLPPGVPPADGQGRNLHNQRLPLSQRQAMARKMNRNQGNHHVQRAAQPIQKAPPAPQNLVKIPYNYTKEVTIDKGKYIKLSNISFTIGGSLEEMPPAGGSTGVTVEAGGTQTNNPRKDALTIKAESKKAADDFFSQKVASLSSSVKPYEKKAAGFSRSDDEAKVNVSYEHGFEIDPFLVQNVQLTTAMEFNILELKKNPGTTPKFHFLSAVPKVEIQGKKENFPISGFQSNLKGEIAATFEPDWVTLGLLALETPIGWALAGAAGGLAIVYFTYKDVERTEQLMGKVRGKATNIVRAASKYADVIAGKTVAPGNKAETDAVNQAKSDLAAIVTPKDMSQDTYYALVEADKLEASYWKQSYQNYKRVALGNLEDDLETEIKAWHDEHWVQSFFAGRYAADDIAAARAAIADISASEGSGFIG